MASSKFRLALIQLAVGASKADNLSQAQRLIKEATKEGAKVVALPECTNSPYGNQYFPDYAEAIPGESTNAFSQAAKENNIFLMAGSIPEREGDKLYNAAMVFNPKGQLIAKHRKMHLFDIDIPGKITFQESKTLTPGSKFTTFDTPYCKFGLAICYDLRFAEMAQIYAKQGCKVLFYPGAFNMATGPVHWKPLQVGRAIDNQVYVVSCSPARDDKASYIAWGHSMAVSPWGEVLAEAEHEEKIIYADIDPAFVDQVRRQVPLPNQRRNDLYEVKDLSK